MNGMLFIELGLDERTARNVDSCAAVVLLFAAIAVLLPRGRAASVSVVGAAFVGTWFLATSLADHALQNTAFAHLALPAAALRVAAPLVLAAAITDRGLNLVRVLRWAIAITFAVHGYEALRLNPKFLDLILLNLNSATGPPLFTERGATLMLNTIGTIDLVVAAALLFLRSPWLAGYMALWGLVTAWSRTGAGGLDAWPAVAIRMTHFAAPLALFLLWRGRGILRR